MQQGTFARMKYTTTESLQVPLLSPLCMSHSGGGNFFRRRRKDNSSSNNESNENNRDKENNSDDEDEEGDDEEWNDTTYLETAASEFSNNNKKDDDEGSVQGRFNNLNSSNKNSSSSIKPIFGKTTIDWGGEYGKLKARVTDIEQGNVGPANALFRLVTMTPPNEAIVSFVKDANPEVVAAMSGTVSSLLGGLSNPTAGMETIVKANKEKLGSLCFQLQMTGYLFRNAEYVLAIKELMKIDSSTATIQDYKLAFHRMDKDGSGYIDIREIQSLLSDVYDGDTPAFEVDAFLNFFDSNKDGKISWSEFEKGLGVLKSTKNDTDTKRKQGIQRSRNRMISQSNKNPQLKGSSNDDLNEEDDDEDEVVLDTDDELYKGDPNISGIIKVEIKSGKVIEIEAKEYMDELKKEAKALKEALQKERGESIGTGNPIATVPVQQSSSQGIGGIAGYIASLQGDVQSLTKGISPDVVEAMKRVVEYVVDGGKTRPKKDEHAELEIPGSALQQLALWQLVLGYKLREAEATGEYRKIMKQ